MVIVFERSYRRIKKPDHINKNIFVLYAPSQVIIEPANTNKIDTEIILLLPKESKAFVTSKFRGDEITRVDAKNNIYG